MKKLGLFLVAVYGWLYFSGCGNGVATTPPPVQPVATHLAVAIPAVISTGVSFPFTVTALDAANNIVPNYNGMVHFSSSDSKAILPPDSPLPAGSSSYLATFNTIGAQTISVADTTNASLKGSSNSVPVASNAATHLSLGTPPTADTRLPFSFSVTALDANNNPSIGYSATIHFTSTDSQAHLPADSTLMNGSAQYSVTFETAGSQTISATAAGTGGLSIISGPITTTAPAPLLISSPAPPNGTVGTGYNPHLVRVCILPRPAGCGLWRNVTEFFFPLSSSGGVTSTTPTWSWAAAPGSQIPPGLQIATGSSFITGTPLPGSKGIYNVIITVTDSGTPSASSSNTYGITINNPPGPTISISPAPPGGLVNQPYTYAIPEQHGFGTLTWVETGALPAGLNFDTTNGTISGTPTATGSFPIQVNVTDSLGQSTGQQPFTIEVFAHGFVPSGDMVTARLLHAATELSGGKVLVTGGQADINTLYASAELFDPTSGTFSPARNMSMTRASHTATLLCDLSATSCSNDKVLIAGGQTGNDSTVTGSAELYLPSAGTFTLTGSMVTARYGHTATLLLNGKVLIAGGSSVTQTLSSAEIWDPSNGSFTSTGPMSAPRMGHTATLLTNGQVLIAGGAGTTSAELYDPSTGVFTQTPAMTAARSYHTATLLKNGSVLLAGSTGPNGNSLDSAELYDPTVNTFTATGNLVTARGQHTAVLLNDGTVLLAGGVLVGTSLRNAELYDPVSGTFSATGGTQAGLLYHAMTALSSGGSAIVIGGDSSQGALASAEVYK